MNLQETNKLRKLAGLSLISEAEVPSHEATENQLFAEACKKMEEVKQMCQDRLAGDVSDEHKKQYEDLIECSQKCCTLLQAHLDSYK